MLIGNAVGEILYLSIYPQSCGNALPSMRSSVSCVKLIFIHVCGMVCIDCGCVTCVLCLCEDVGFVCRLSMPDQDRGCLMPTCNRDWSGGPSRERGH